MTENTNEASGAARAELAPTSPSIAPDVDVKQVLDRAAVEAVDYIRRLVAERRVVYYGD